MVEDKFILLLYPTAFNVKMTRIKGGDVDNCITHLYRACWLAGIQSTSFSPLETRK